jgi:hypothetical protein
LEYREALVHICYIAVASYSTDALSDGIYENTNSQIVYTTKTGKRYHSRKTCSGLSNANAIYESTLSQAKGKGLTPCAKCY